MNDPIIKEVPWTNPVTNEKFIHRERQSGQIDFFYGPRETFGEGHGHTRIINGNVQFDRNPGGKITGKF